MSKEELPEWFQMIEEFFDEVRCFSTTMYEEMGGHAKLNQARYAAMRDKAQIDKEDLEDSRSLTPIGADSPISATCECWTDSGHPSAIEEAQNKCNSCGKPVHL